ncbi:TetR/AcrR family transcriptional regulator [Nocardioides guangzhouensis]|uniref:TetR/AcrR family transcriptional regulator n=1 Tax=Nocardioides guangzhouensis TaxID=2497878 RepID=A0A4Q4ZF00_9ACTN|nr:TetR family transcriptional regulator [Nocardioides guangzhouensis]RYP85824.1 TetR/AcrR family transcriptional regulator [Nocardioides guangzhouensis]
MTSTRDDPRPTKSQRTKAAILVAAREHFARDGYDRTTVRSVAAQASVDPALVIRYFSSKEALFAAAVDVDLMLPDLASVPRGELGARLTRHFLERWEGGLSDDVLVILLRSAVSNEQAADRLRAVFSEQVASTIGALAPRRDAGRRAGLVASQLLGLALTRYLLRLPGIADRPADDVLADVGPTIQRYLTQDLG